MQNTGQSRSFLPRIVKQCLIIALSLWLSGTVGIWAFVTYHQKIPGVLYSDLLLPSRWQGYQEARSNHYLAQAAICLHDGEAQAAVRLLRAGINLKPNSPRARALLANIYLQAKQPDLARQILQEGLASNPTDLPYLRSVLTLLHDLQQDGSLLVLAQTSLGSPEKLPPEGDALLSLSGARAAYNLCNHRAAQAFLSRPSLRHSPEAVCLLAKIEWADGWPELALLRLQAGQQAHPGNPAIDQLLGRCLLALGRQSEWRIHLLNAQWQRPTDPAPRLSLLRHYHETHNEIAVQAAFGDYAQQFSANTPALLQLADFVAETGRPDLARRLIPPLSSTRDQLAAFHLLLAEAHLGAAQYRESLALLAGAAPDLPEALLITRTGLRAVAHLGLGQADEARLQITRLLGLENLNPAPLVALAARLRSLGADDLAASLLTRACELDPRHQPALLAIVALELEQANLTAHPAHLTALLATRRPPRDLLQRVHDELGSDRHLLHSDQVPLLASLRPALARASRLPSLD